MSNENPTVDDPQVEEPQSEEPVGPTVEELQAQLAEKNERIAALEPLEQAQRDAEEAAKSELQKLQDAQSERDAKIAALTAENTRLSLAQTYGLSEEDFGLLGSGTAEQMEANAKRVQELRAAAAKAPEPVPSDRPVDGLRPVGAEKKKQEGTSYPSNWAV